jgi:hypothetical protein
MEAQLKGEARRFLSTVDMNRIRTVNDLHLKLLPVFGDRINWHAKLQSCRQEPGEKIKQFSQKIKVATKKAHGSCDDAAFDNACLQHMKSHCLPEVKEILRHCLPGTSFDVVIQHIVELENSGELDYGRKAAKRKNDGVMAGEVTVMLDN